LDYNLVFTSSVEGSQYNSEYSKDENIKKLFTSKIISKFEKEANQEK
jgi:hypothetical protein